MSSTPAMITVKWQHEGRYRRFALDTSSEQAYARLRQAVAEIAPGSAVTLAWRDADGDEIVIGSQIELTDALNNRQGDVLRVHTYGEAPISTASTPTVEAPKLLEGKKTEAPQQEQQKSRHQAVICDGCAKQPLVGMRYKCVTCPDYDLCEECMAKRLHSEHNFLSIADSTDRSWRENWFRMRRPGSFHGRGPMGWGQGHGHGPFRQRNGCPGGGSFRGFPFQMPVPPVPPVPPMPKQQKTSSAQPEAPKAGEQKPEDKYPYNEAFKSIFDDVSRLINENKDTFSSGGDYLRQIGQAAAEALSQLGIDADIDIENDKGERERMQAKKKAEEEATKKAHEMDTQNEGGDKPEPIANPMDVEETPVVLPTQPTAPTVERAATPEVEIMDGGNWQFVNRQDADEQQHQQLYPSVDASATSSAAAAPSAPASSSSAESECLAQLLSMGFANDGGWLEAIVKAKQGDLNQVLNALQRKD